MEVRLEEIRETAEDYYRRGEFYCSESIVKTLKDVFKPELSDDIITMASGFPVGMGKAGCSCGAVVGAQMTIGLIFGRSKGKGKEVEKAMELSKEIHDIFVAKNKVVCCRILTNGMKMGSKEHMSQCIRFTGEMAYETAKIIARELEMETTDVKRKKGFMERLFKR